MGPVGPTNKKLKKIALMCCSISDNHIHKRQSSALQVQAWQVRLDDIDCVRAGACSACVHVCFQAGHGEGGLAFWPAMNLAPL